MKFRSSLFPYLIIAPTIIYLFFLLVYPWLITVIRSFQEYNPRLGIEPHFIGLVNYETIFSDSTFWLSIYNTGILAIFAVTIELLLGILLASLLNRRLKFQRFYRTAILIPMMMSPALAAIVWKLLVFPEYGVFDYILESLHLPTLLWAASPDTALLTIGIIDIWQNTPFCVLLLLAGLQSIPLEQYEASKIDGAGIWQTFKFLTIPHLYPFIAITLLFRVVFIIRTFDVVYLLVGPYGGPNGSAMTLGLYLWYKTFLLWDLGLSSAISFVLLGVGAISTAIFIWYLYRKME